MSQAPSRRGSQVLPPLRDVIASLSLDDCSPCCSPTTKKEFFEVVDVIRSDTAGSLPHIAAGDRWTAPTDGHESLSPTIPDYHRTFTNTVQPTFGDMHAAFTGTRTARRTSSSHSHIAAHTSTMHTTKDLEAGHNLDRHGFFELSTDQPLQLLPGLCPSLAGHEQAEYKGIGKLGTETVFLYTGGYYLPTHIDGEPVNAHWGLTKANTPRKRLATACDRCRQKKTRCDSTPEGCVQCQKAGKTCQT